MLSPIREVKSASSSLHPPFQPINISINSSSQPPIDSSNHPPIQSIIDEEYYPTKPNMNRNEREKSLATLEGLYKKIPLPAGGIAPSGHIAILLGINEIAKFKKPHYIKVILF